MKYSFPRHAIAALVIVTILGGCSNYQMVKPNRPKKPAVATEVAVEEQKNTPAFEQREETPEVAQSEKSFWQKMKFWKKDKKPAVRALPKEENVAWSQPANVNQSAKMASLAQEQDEQIAWNRNMNQARQEAENAQREVDMAQKREENKIVWGQNSNATAYNPGTKSTDMPVSSYNPPREPTRDLPPLVVTNEPPPEVIYRRGSHDTLLMGSSATVVRKDPLRQHKIETPVTQKAREIQRDVNEANKKLDASTRKLETLQNKNRVETSEYYGLVATINSALQTGTTPGNPILVDRWNAAQDKLNQLSKTSSLINNLSVDLSYQASKASFVLESVKAAFELSGAVDSDHETLMGLEDDINQNITDLNRLIVKVNAELNRLATLLRTERENMQTLSLGIAKGELYGANIKNTVFRKQDTIPSDSTGYPGSRKALVIIKFNKPSVNYDKPLYTAVSQALEKKPNAKFDLVAVSPKFKNPAKESMLSNEAKKDGERVLNSLTKMGMPASRLQLSSELREEAKSSEVHIYLR